MGSYIELLSLLVFPESLRVWRAAYLRARVRFKNKKREDKWLKNVNCSASVVFSKNTRCQMNWLVKDSFNSTAGGHKMDQCKRKEYRKMHGAPPSDDMMFSGQTIVVK